MTFITPALSPAWEKQCRSELLRTSSENQLQTTDTEIMSEEAME